MIKIEEIKGKEMEEIQTLLATELAEYNAVINTMEMDQLKQEESKLIDEMKANDEYIKNVSYQLKDFVSDENGEEVKASEIQKYMVGFLNNIECTWQTTLGVYQAIVFWKNMQPGQGVPYGAYDSTSRLLGTLKYKGESDLRRILMVNNYLAAAREGYMEDTMYINYLAAMHDGILKAMQALLKEPEPVNE